MDDSIYMVALGGLLHDIGKFMQRAELEKDFDEIKKNYEEFCPTANSYLHAAHTAFFVERFIPETIVGREHKTELYNAARHHKNPPGDIYREADCLSAGMERYEDEKDSSEYKQVRLHSIFDAVELQYAIRDRNNRLNSRWRYLRSDLSEKNSVKLYPLTVDEITKTDTGGLSYRELWYRELWDKFKKELDLVNKPTSLANYFNTLYWLFEKYTWCIPSATNAYPDISLFDHLKTTSSIASCFWLRRQENISAKPDFILYAGDISGIQDYIFRISRSQGVGGISKRLRGRSFYIAMLTEVLSRYIIQRLGLTIANVNYCGGGNFELLLPNTGRVTDFLDGLKTEINKWLIDEFHGLLGYEDAKVEMTTNELRDDYGKKKDALADRLQLSKLKKNLSQLDEDSFWVDRREIDGKITICPSCNLKLIRKTENICELCQKDKDIGSLLPQAEYLVFSDLCDFHQEDATITFGQFGEVVLLPKMPSMSTSRLTDTAQFVYTLSKDTDDGMPRYFLAQTLPLALKEMTLETEKDEYENKIVRKGQTLSFSTLADMAQGDKRIGILKMDVDNLGLIFSTGLDTLRTEKRKVENLRSISRLSTISRQMSLFFAINIEILCRDIFTEWQNDEKNKWAHKKDVSNIFYLVFAGGDDLVVVGPWDRVIDLARRIRKSFKDFTCHNPNISLSSGIYICKPKFPVSIAADKADEALKQAKDAGRNRITVMGKTFVWDVEHKKSRIYQEELRDRYPASVYDENEIHSEKIFMKQASKSIAIPTLTFEEASHFAEELKRYYEDDCISRQFVFTLLRAGQEFFVRIYNDIKNHFEEEHNFMFLPHLLYNIERNVSKNVKNEIKGNLVSTGEAQKYIRQAYYPCKVFFMKTKK